MKDKITKLDFAQRWLRDGLQECGRAGAIEAVEVDVTVATAVLQQLKSDGAGITWTHVFVRAAAMALDRNPDLHRLVAGNSSLHPSTVDICLSIAGDDSVTPVLIIQDAARKGLGAIAEEVKRRTPDAVEESRKMVAGLRKVGWLVPFAVLRRGLIGFLLRRSWYRRKVSGTFQVSCVPQVDLFAPFLFNSVGALGVGRVRDKVVAVDGQAVVRPSVTLCCCFDHAQWNGMAAARFLTSLREIVESAEFAGTTALPAATIAPVARVR